MYNYKSRKSYSKPLYHNTAGSILNITFHLADAISEEKKDSYWDEARQSRQSYADFAIQKKNYQILQQNWLDECQGECILDHPEYASIVQEQIFKGNHGIYEILGWSILPNHVHLMLYMLENKLGYSIQKIKQASTSLINQEASSPMISPWNPGYIFRQIRSEYHFNQSLQYLESSPEICRCTDEFTGTSPHLKEIIREITFPQKEIIF